MGAAILIFGPIIGDWVDRTPRLSGAWELGFKIFQLTI
jgi:hypothetical protein